MTNILTHHCAKLRPNIYHHYVTIYRVQNFPPDSPFEINLESTTYKSLKRGVAEKKKLKNKNRRWLKVVLIQNLMILLADK